MLGARDTDADWTKLGASEPFWGVLTGPEHLSANLDAQAIAAFYETGRSHIDYVRAHAQRLTGEAPPVRRALDFGCGVGRLSEAMAAHAEETFGYDIAAPMLAQARARSAGGVRYVDAMPAGPFDWINSYIVFQHIPPKRGLELLDDLLSRLAPGGLLTLQITIYNEERFVRPLLRSSWGRRLIEARRWFLPKGVISMYAYDFSSVCRVLHRHGVQTFTAMHENHGGYHAVLLIGRRT